MTLSLSSKSLDVAGKYSLWHYIVEFRSGKEKMTSVTPLGVANEELLS